ncbi:unnamed protein product [Enterobius vermicularis]|uniref:Thyrotropin-releasing hormone receptor n=1 Tax=Enterobius vermicularis TaxID=51028 RepID=A0A0N4V5R1_ENTVE|nr:unnamed protein product [Enterobius vermicularis]
MQKNVLIPANPVTFFAIVTQRSLRSPTNVFLAALSVVDFFVGVFCVGQNAIHLSYINEGTWPLGSQACKIYIYFIHMLPSVSAGLLVLLSLERMIAVKFPMIASKILKYSITIPSTLLVWLCAGISNFPFYIGARFKQYNNYFSGCFPEDANPFNRGVLVFNIFAWFIIPCIFLAIANTWTAITICASIKKGTVARSTSTSKSNHSSKTFFAGRFCFPRRKKIRTRIYHGTIDERRRVGYIQIAIFIIFVCLQSPRRMYLLYRNFFDQAPVKSINGFVAKIHPLTFLMQFAVSAINPLIYGFLSRRFRQAILSMLCCHKDRERRRQQVCQNAYRHASKQESASFHTKHPLLTDVRLDRKSPVLNFRNGNQINSAEETLL